MQNMFSQTKSWLSKCMIIIVWLMSYIVIMLFPLIASTFSFISGNKIIRSYIDENFRLSASITAKNMDHLMLVSLKLASQISTDGDMNMLCTAVANSDGDVTEASAKISKYLRSLKIGNESIENIVLILNNGIVTYDNGFCTLSQFYSGYFSECFPTLSDFNKMLSAGKDSGFRFLDDYSPGPRIIYTEPLSVQGNTAPIGKIMIISDYRGVTDKSLLSGASFAVTEQGSLLAAGRNTDWNNLKKIIKTGGSSRFALQAVKSKVNPSWTYYYTDNIEQISSVQKSYKTVTFVSYSASIILGILFMLIFISYNSLHINNILSYIKRQLKTDKIKFSYNSIENGIKNIEQQNNELNLQYINQQTLIQSYIFSQWLLYGRVPKDYSDISDFCGGDGFVVLLISIQHEKDGGNPAVILRGFMENIFSKIFLSVNMIEFDHITAAILELSSESDYKSDISSAIDKIVSAAAPEQFAIDYSCSSVHTTADDMNTAYNEAMEVMTFKANYPADVVYFYDDLSFSNDKSYYFPMEIERKLIDCILKGDGENAVCIVENLYTVNITKKCLPLNISKCFMLDILSSVIKSAVDIPIHPSHGINDFIETNNPIDEIMHSNNLLEIKNVLCAFMEKLCHYLDEHNISDCDSVSERAKKIILKRYTDCNLSSTFIADELGLSRDYFLRLFKAQSGASVSDYLNHIRTQEACRLLKESKMTVSEVAQSVGYSSIKTFNRVFTKAIGITPGKYRSNE